LLTRQFAVEVKYLADYNATDVCTLTDSVARLNHVSP